MSGFKDMVAADIDNVFLNEDEFAETHTLEGNTCVCVITNDRTKRVTRSARNFSGLHGDFLCVVVKTSSLQREPKQGENFRVDSKLYKMASCTEDMGVYTIQLAAYRMGVP